MLSIPLGSAQLCPEATCEELFSLSDAACPKCGSAGLPLQRLLNDRADYSELVATAKEFLVGYALSVRQRKRLLAALHTAGITV